jgi:hypothetical protein
MSTWRETMRPTRFFGVDSRATLPMLFFLMNMNSNTFMLAIAGMVGFSFLERKGLTVPAAIRAVRAWIAGPIRPATPWWLARRYIDYGE